MWQYNSLNFLFSTWCRSGEKCGHVHRNKSNTQVKWNYWTCYGREPPSWATIQAWYMSFVETIVFSINRGQVPIYFRYQYGQSTAWVCKQLNKIRVYGDKRVGNVMINSAQSLAQEVTSFCLQGAAATGTKAYRLAKIDSIFHVSYNHRNVCILESIPYMSRASEYCTWNGKRQSQV